MKKKIGVEFALQPYAPEGAKAFRTFSKLSAVRDAMTHSMIDTRTEFAVRELIEKWCHKPDEVEPIREMQKILEPIRCMPPGDERLKLMNTIVRTLGQPDILAVYLDMLRDSAMRDNTPEQQFCKDKLQSVKLHSIYGWCGNTLMVESFEMATKGTFAALPGLEDKLGNSTATWNLTIHIWQPNLMAKGFPIKSQLKPGTIIEPPHTHPFDFVSMVVKGDLHQSIYKQLDNFPPDSGNKSASDEGYYNNIQLEHVDGVWPPHDFHNKRNLKTLEHRVLLEAGDSYYMPCDWIHDVEIDGNLAASKPTITLFLSSEYLVMPHVYMTTSMSDFHKKNPNIKTQGKKLSEKAWHNKLKAIAGYLRGETEMLNLNDIVKHTGEYAFFHV